MTINDFIIKWNIRFATNDTFEIDEQDFREFKDDIAAFLAAGPGGTATLSELNLPQPVIADSLYVTSAAIWAARSSFNAVAAPMPGPNWRLVADFRPAITAASITDASPAGRSLLTAASPAVQLGLLDVLDIKAGQYGAHPDFNRAYQADGLLLFLLRKAMQPVVAPVASAPAAPTNGQVDDQGDTFSFLPTSANPSFAQYMVAGLPQTTGAEWLNSANCYVQRGRIYVRVVGAVPAGGLAVFVGASGSIPAGQVLINADPFTANNVVPTVPGALQVDFTVDNISLSPGDALGFTAKASGGTAPYTHSVQALNPDTGAVTILGTANTASYIGTWKTVAGVYLVTDAVTDSAGTSLVSTTRRVVVALPGSGSGQRLYKVLGDEEDGAPTNKLLKSTAAKKADLNSATGKLVDSQAPVAEYPLYFDNGTYKYDDQALYLEVQAVGKRVNPLTGKLENDAGYTTFAKVKVQPGVTYESVNLGIAYAAYLDVTNAWRQAWTLDANGASSAIASYNSRAFSPPTNGSVTEIYLWLSVRNDDVAYVRIRPTQLYNDQELRRLLAAVSNQTLFNYVPLAASSVDNYITASYFGSLYELSFGSGIDPTATNLNLWLPLVTSTNVKQSVVVRLLASQTGKTVSVYGRPAATASGDRVLLQVLKPGDSAGFTVMSAYGSSFIGYGITFSTVLPAVASGGSGTGAGVATPAGTALAFTQDAEYATVYNGTFSVEATGARAGVVVVVRLGASATAPTLPAGFVLLGDNTISGDKRRYSFCVAPDGTIEYYITRLP